MKLKQEKQTLHYMEERHLDIMKLEDNIRELHGMFIELADIVDTQVQYSFCLRVPPLFFGKFFEKNFFLFMCGIDSPSVGIAIGV